MALEQKLSLKLTQKLVMTPSLQQAIKLLQMTRIELEGVITQEMMENPTLEEARLETAEEPVSEEETRDKETKDDELDHEESLEDIDLDEFFGDYMESSGYASVSEHREAPPLENTLSRDPDLYDHLLWQLHMADIPERRREIAELIIGNLDPQGFLVAELEEIRALGDQPVGRDGSDDNGAGPDGGDEEHEPFTLDEVEEALELVRSFDPPGVGYATLCDSLIAQLDRAGVETEVDELARRMLDEHWDAFLKRQYPAIAKKIGVPLHDLEPAVERIKNLETRPGRGFNTERAHYIEPDVYVRKVGDEWVIQINDDGMPRLRVSRAYRKMLAKMRKEGRQADAQQFIKDKIRSAIWLIKSIDQRQRTIHKVANSIVRQQQEFLEHGIDRLRPMVLRDVAEDIGMHESTVSRVVSNKYIHTPRGVLPMKYFFHSGIDREFGEEISSLTVKRKISQMIDEEDPKRPLSDSELMRILNREGIQIARRTVAKYRDELNIPSSTDRKQIF
ncbi:MAG: RNA polymerase factor sigma-54 [Acidobacteriota bacterium]|jgi:RNA polymerase sigma-54 factor